MALPFTIETAHIRFQLLESLIPSLPTSLPFNDSEDTSFALDLDDVEDEGSTYALNCCFEINWGHKNDGIITTERGTKLLCTLAIIDDVIPTAMDISIVILWIDALIHAALDAGATPLVLSFHPVETHMDLQTLSSMNH